MSHHTYGRRAYEQDFAECETLRVAVNDLYDRIDRAKKRINGDRARDQLGEMQGYLTDGLYDSGDCGTRWLNAVLDEIEGEAA